MNNVERAFCLISNLANIDNKACIGIHNNEVPVHYVICGVVATLVIGYSFVVNKGSFGDITPKITLGIGVIAVLSLCVFASVMIFRLIKNENKNNFELHVADNKRKSIKSK